MKEWTALTQLRRTLDVGDDCAVIETKNGKLVLTTDMLHQETDIPDGATPETMGWRAMAVSLSDVAAMAAQPTAGVLAVGVPDFTNRVYDIVEGARQACESVDTSYVGGDLDQHQETTLVSSLIGETDEAIYRHGSKPGDLVCVTGKLGKTCRALQLFEIDADDEANDLFRFTPRTREGVKLRGYVSSMMDVSDGLSVSLHQMKEASGNGFKIESSKIPKTDGVELSDAVHLGGDYELVFTCPENPGIEEIDYTVIGECIDENQVYIDDNKLEKKGYQHG